MRLYSRFFRRHARTRCQSVSLPRRSKNKLAHDEAANAEHASDPHACSSHPDREKHFSPKRSTSLFWYVLVSTPGTGRRVGEISSKNLLMNSVPIHRKPTHARQSGRVKERGGGYREATREAGVSGMQRHCLTRTEEQRRPREIPSRTSDEDTAKRVYVHKPSNYGVMS